MRPLRNAQLRPHGDALSAAGSHAALPDPQGACDVREAAMKLCLECAAIGFCAGVIGIYLALMFGNDSLVSL
jgi:hypothetical protein